MNVPDDLKTCYKTNVQMQRTFRDDKDTVAIAKRTVELIERIAELEADRDSWRRVCERLEAENAMLVQQLSGIAKDIERYDSQNLLLTEQVERLSAPVTDDEAQVSFETWNSLFADSTTWDELDEGQQARWKLALLAARKGAAS